MPEEVRHADGRLEHPSVRFERTDASFGCILAILAASVVLAGATFYALYWFFTEYRTYQARIKESPFPLAPAPSTSLPREPRLEQLDRVAGVETPNVYLRELDKEQTLNSLGPTEEKGFVHIPIDRALDLLADKLPARAAPPPEQQRRAGGLVDAGEPNSGRAFRAVLTERTTETQRHRDTERKQNE